MTVTGTTVAGLPVTATAGGSLALTSDAPRRYPDGHPATASPGTVLTYTVQVRNTGNVSLRGVSAASDRLGAITLASGQSCPRPGNDRHRHAHHRRGRPARPLHEHRHGDGHAALRQRPGRDRN